MPRERRFTPRQIETKWEEYKQYCDNYKIKQMVRVVKYEDGDRIETEEEKEVLSPITYTLLGFCRFLKITRQAIYDHYYHHPEYESIFAFITGEIEDDARRKFETGQINGRLAGMWMSSYEGYVQKTQQSINLTTSDDTSKALEKYFADRKAGDNNG